jgi:hypothetical protein
MKNGARTTAAVNVHVRDLSQMFNSLDPSPFWDRDLDRSAAAFIEDEFGEKQSAKTWHLHVHAIKGAELAGHLQVAVENYYDRLAASARRELMEHRRMGHVALIFGLAFLLLSMSARELLLGFFGGLPLALDEGLIILAWVGLWRPAEMLAYEWIPVRRKRRLYERLAAVHVTVHTDTPVTTSTA